MDPACGQGLGLDCQEAAVNTVGMTRQPCVSNLEHRCLSASGVFQSVSKSTIGDDQLLFVSPDNLQLRHASVHFMHAHQTLLQLGNTACSFSQPAEREAQPSKVFSTLQQAP